MDPALAHEGAGLFRALAASAPDEVLLCTDLHAENVLAAERAEWLVIDPKPFVGDPTYDALQHLLTAPAGCAPTRGLRQPCGPAARARPGPACRVALRSVRGRARRTLPVGARAARQLRP